MSPASASGSTTVLSKLTASGAVPVLGVAVAETSGAAVIAAPLPRKSIQLRFISPPWSVGWRNTKNSWCVPSGGLGRASSTFLKSCQPVVGVIIAVSATSGPSAASSRTWIVPPAPPEATRKRRPLMPSRFIGVYDT